MWGTEEERIEGKKDFRRMNQQGATYSCKEGTPPKLQNAHDLLCTGRPRKRAMLTSRLEEGHQDVKGERRWDEEEARFSVSPLSPLPRAGTSHLAMGREV